MNITLTYTDFKQLEADSAKLADVKKVLETEFPDDTCALIAVKAILGIEEATGDGETSDPSDPGSDPSGSGSTDPSDPSTP